LNAAYNNVIMRYSTNICIGKPLKHSEG